MTFRELLENDIINIKDIELILTQMSSDEINEFGEWLYSEIFEDEDFDEDFDIDEVMELLNNIPQEDLEYVYFMLQDIVEDDIEDFDNGDVVEDISRFTAKNMNKAKKKFSLTKSQLRAQKAKRKKDNRKNKAARKANYRKNKVKIKRYNKAYNKAVKTGKHKKKIRR